MDIKARRGLSGHDLQMAEIWDLMEEALRRESRQPIRTDGPASGDKEEQERK